MKQNLHISPKSLPFLHSGSPDATSIKTSRVITDYNSILEYLFYGYLFYANLSAAYGFDIPILGVTWLMALAGLSLLARKPSRHSKTYLYWIAGICVSYLVIQTLIFDLSLEHARVKPLLIWLPMVLVIDRQIDNPKFFGRFIFVMFCIALLALPRVILLPAAGGLKRAGTQGTGFGNPNDFGAWLGFCALGFWMLRLQEPARYKRWVLWGFFLLASLLMLQTVSRGALVALTAALLTSVWMFKLKQKLKISVLLAGLISASLLLPSFSGRVEHYQRRGMEEPGRMGVWPVAVEAILEQPWLGVGADELDLYVPTYAGGHALPPHNTFLSLWLAGGIVPMTLFVGLWIAMILLAVKFSRMRDTYHLNPLPLVVAMLIQMLLGDFRFSQVWAVFTICYLFSRRPELK